MGAKNARPQSHPDAASPAMNGLSLSSHIMNIVPSLLQPKFIPADMRLRISNAEFRNLDSVNHCTSKEMPNLDSVNHCTSKTESRFGISKFGIPIEIRNSPVNVCSRPLAVSELLAALQ